MSTSEAAIKVLKKVLKNKTADKFEVGTVIRWTGGGRFVYVAIKTEAGWFTSARTGNYFVDSRFDTFEDFVEVLSRSDSTNIEIATAWEAI